MRPLRPSEINDNLDAMARNGKRRRARATGAVVGTPQEPIWKRTGPVCLGLFALAVLARLLFLNATVDRDLPFSIFYYGDSRLYREFALAILRGQPFDLGIPYHPPLMAYLLAAIIDRVGENPAAVRAILAAVSALTAPLTYLLGIRIWDRAVALTAALLTIFSFGLLVAAVSPNVEAIYVPILAAQALTVIALGDALASGGHRSPGGTYPGDGRPVPGRGTTARAWFLCVLTGLLLGLGSLARAEHLGLILMVPAALAIGWPAAGLRRIAGASCVGAACAALVIAPWTLHNHRALDRFNRENPWMAEPFPVFVLVSNYGALNFALANSPGADGSFKPDRIVGTTGGGRLDLHDPRQLNLYLHGYSEGLGYLVRHPSEALVLIGRKLGIASEAAALGFGLSDWPEGLEGTRRAVDMFSPARKVLLPFSFLLVAAGAWRSRTAWRRTSPIWLIGIHKVLICAAFYGYVRLFVHLGPFAYLLQASALVGLVSRLRSPAARRAVSGLGFAGALFLLLELGAGVLHPRNFTASGSTDPESGTIIQDAEVLLAPAP